MPELPEVETVKRILESQILGKKIIDIDVIYDKILENVDSSTFIRELVGEEFSAFTRRGKYLIFLFKKHTLVVHLRMEGKFFIKDYEEVFDKHEHIVLRLEDGTSLRYHDTRKFGKFVLLNTVDLNEVFEYPSLKKMGPDANLTSDYLSLYYRLQKMSCPIKQALLDQTLIAGLGNIYVDEVCFLSKIHPSTRCCDLGMKQVSDILKNSKIVLEKAILLGGTTIRSYTSSLGVTGRFQNELLVHSRKDQECYDCGSKIKKIRVAGRGTYYCPKCQKDLNKVKVVGVTGLIASGKTMFTDYLKSKGFVVIDCDEINREILGSKSSEYPELFERIQDLFPSVIVDGLINRRALRELIFDNYIYRKMLEELVYPVIKSVVLSRIKAFSKVLVASNKPRVLFLSAPLLFEADFDLLCDEVIIIKADEKILLERLCERDGLEYDEAKNALSIRMTANELIQEAKNKNFEPYIIDNSTDLYSLQYYADKTLKKLMED
ncbi:MAG: DNA-formamidopyrimidine glycosylase [Bacilli bacterium]|nr:DNA-formamidopyrimidine glycosylase [Bacilli bacterium]